MARTRNFADVIRAKLAANLDLADAVESEDFNADVAMKVYEARTQAGLSQKKLAELVGTQQSVISRIEDADYDGHSLKLLKRIAAALGNKLQVEFYSSASVKRVEVVGVYLPVAASNTIPAGKAIVLRGPTERYFSRESASVAAKTLTLEMVL